MVEDVSKYFQVGDSMEISFKKEDLNFKRYMKAVSLAVYLLCKTNCFQMHFHPDLFLSSLITKEPLSIRHLLVFTSNKRAQVSKVPLGSKCTVKQYYYISIMVCKPHWVLFFSFTKNI